MERRDHPKGDFMKPNRVCLGREEGHHPHHWNYQTGQRLKEMIGAGEFQRPFVNPGC